MLPLLLVCRFYLTSVKQFRIVGHLCLFVCISELVCYFFDLHNEVLKQMRKSTQVSRPHTDAQGVRVHMGSLHYSFAMVTETLYF